MLTEVNVDLRKEEKGMKKQRKREREEGRRKRGREGGKSDRGRRKKGGRRGEGREKGGKREGEGREKGGRREGEGREKGRYVSVSMSGELDANLHHVTQTISMSNSRCSFVVDATSTSFSCDNEGRSTPFSSYSPSLAVKYSSVRMWGREILCEGEWQIHTHTQPLHPPSCHLTHRYTPSHTIPCPTSSHTSLTSCRFH